jgi:hypothetical protein
MMLQQPAFRVFLTVPIVFMMLAGCTSTSPETVISDLSTDGKVLDLNTEIASFYLFHPDDLKHRETSPHDWRLYSFAMGPEFAAGNLVAFETGGDGGYRLRLTQGELTDRERKLQACSWDFRYKARHGRVLIDGGEHLPSETNDPILDIIDPQRGKTAAQEQPIPTEQWYALADGDYKVIVHAIAWEKEPGAVVGGERASNTALPAYVIQFTKIERLETIPSALAAPRLETELGYKPGEPKGVSPDEPLEENESEPVPQNCPVIITRELVVAPGSVTQPTNMSAGLYERFLPGEPRQGSEPIRFVALLDSEEVPRIAVLAELASGAAENENAAFVSFRPLRLVKVEKLERGKDGLDATVSPVVRAKGSVPPANLALIKSDFTAYARSNAAYRKAVPHADFEADRVAAMSSPSAITNLLLHHVQMPARERVRLFPFSDTDRIKELLTVMKSP